MIYPGPIPSNVSKDAKYSIRSGPDGYVVKLLFRLTAREEALLATDRHTALVDMVNAVKIEHTGKPGGAFYINEFCDVIVPCDGNYYFADTYQKVLEFEFEGQIIGPRAPEGLRPGDEWPGPHVGVAYTLKAGATDIEYKRPLRDRVTETVRLSDFHDEADVSALTRRFASIKGPGGGRIYVNECGEAFSPTRDGHKYLGHLGEDVWFPAPDVPRP